LAKYPLITSTKQLQLKFALNYLNDNTYQSKDMFIKLRDNKFDKQAYLTDYYNNNFMKPIYFSG
jgi:hypothetical protein